MKFNRNSACWCGSGMKYKNCHMAFDDKINSYARKNILVPSHDIIKTPAQIEGIREAGKLNTLVLDTVADKIKIGMSTEEINEIVHKTIIENGGVPATLGYQGYPKSVCTSINDVICHGIPSKDEILQDGDIINVDVTTILNGYYADASRMFMLGNVKPEDKKLVEVTKECLDLGLEQAQAWGRLGNIGYVIDKHATENGYQVVQDIGGHGTGIEFHEDPYVCHVGSKDSGMLLVPGMVFTIEPMINMGEEDFFTDEDNGWTVYTEDGLPSAQWEYTLVITENGPEILTH